MCSSNGECNCIVPCKDCLCNVYRKYKSAFFKSGYLLKEEGHEKFFWNPKTGVKLAWDGKTFVEI